MNAVLFMHFPGEKDARLYSEKYRDMAVEYCKEYGANLLIILEGNGPDNKKSQAAVQWLIKDELIEEVLFPNLFTIALDYKVAGKLVEMLSAFNIKIRFLDYMKQE